MGRAPCCDKQGLKKGPWTPEEDEILIEYIKRNGHGSWRSLPKLAGLLRCGKSCRLRWTNYLRPDIKRGPFTTEEEKTIIQLHGILGNRWSSIASQLPGRTDNEIKNFWNTHLKKRLLRMGLDPHTHAPSSPAFGLIASSSASPAMRHMAQWESARLEAEARLSQESVYYAQSDPGPTFVKTESDYFLRIWNSDVGESFRTAGPTASGPDTTTCLSPLSPAYSTTKYGAAGAATVSTVTSERCDDLESKSCGSEADDSFSSLDDSSETSLQLLLDLPGDEMGFFQGQIGNLSTLFPDE